MAAALTLLLLLTVALMLLMSRIVVWPLVVPRRLDTGPTQPRRETALALEQHVRAVASKPHNVAHADALENAARYIETTLDERGLTTRRDSYPCGGTDVRNIEIVWTSPGHHACTPTVVIGAHYDSAGSSPGANDNGSGVAALIEIAGRFALSPPVLGKRLRMVFFVNEEAPWGKTGAMGSLRHAQSLAARGELVEGMVALETLGYFSDKAGTQRLPFPFNLIYPDAGNFVAFVGLPGSGIFLRKAVRAFRDVSRFPSAGAIAPSYIEGADLSDHWAYHQLRFPALMITDTAPYRNPFYHKDMDTPDTVDYLALARVTDGVEGMLRALLAER